MAYSRYDNHGDGSMTFHGEGVPSIMAAGPAAELRAAHIDAENGAGHPLYPAGGNVPPPMPDQRLAENDASVPMPEPEKPGFLSRLGRSLAMPGATMSPSTNGSLVDGFKGALVGTPFQSRGPSPEATPEPAGPAAPSAAPQLVGHTGHAPTAAELLSRASGPTGAVVPAHERLSSRTEKETSIPEAQQRALDEARSGVKGAMGKLTEIDAQKADLAAQVGASDAERIARFDAEAAARQAQRDTLAHSKLVEVDKANEEAANGHVGFTGAGKIFAAIAMGLGAAGSTHGGDNPAAVIIDQIIASQKADLASKRAGANEKGNLFKMNMELLGNEQAAEARTRMTLADEAKRHIEAIMAGTNSAEIKARGAAQIAEFDKTNAENDAKVRATVNDRTFKEVPAGPAGGTTPHFANVEDKLVVTGADGKYYQAFNEQGANELRKFGGQANIAQEAASRMAEIAKNYPVTDIINPASLAGKQMAFQRERFVNSYNSLMGQGVVRSDDIARYNDFIGSPISPTTVEAARGLARNVGTTYEGQLRSMADTKTPLTRGLQRVDPKTNELAWKFSQTAGEEPGNGEKKIDFTPAGK